MSNIGDELVCIDRSAWIWWHGETRSQDSGIFLILEHQRPGLMPIMRLKVENLPTARYTTRGSYAPPNESS